MEFIGCFTIYRNNRLEVIETRERLKTMQLGIPSLAVFAYNYIHHY